MHWLLKNVLIPFSSFSFDLQNKGCIYCFYCPAGRIGPPPGLSCRDSLYFLQRVRAAAPAGYVLMPGYNGHFIWVKMWNYSLNPVSHYYFNVHALIRIPHSLPQICLHLFRSVSCKLYPHSVLGNKFKQKEAYMLLSKNCSIQMINISSLANFYLSPSFISPMCVASVISCIITLFSVLFLSFISSLSLQSRTAAMVPFLNSSFHC